MPALMPSLKLRGTRKEGSLSKEGKSYSATSPRTGHSHTADRVGRWWCSSIARGTATLGPNVSTPNLKLMGSTQRLSE